MSEFYPKIVASANNIIPSLNLWKCRPTLLGYNRNHILGLTKIVKAKDTLKWRRHQNIEDPKFLKILLDSNVYFSRTHILNKTRMILKLLYIFSMALCQQNVFKKCYRCNSLGFPISMVIADKINISCNICYAFVYKYIYEKLLMRDNK